MATVHFQGVERAFQALVGKCVELFVASRAELLSDLYALNAALTIAVAAARDLVRFVQHEQTDRTVSLH